MTEEDDATEGCGCYLLASLRVRLGGRDWWFTTGRDICVCGGGGHFGVALDDEGWIDDGEAERAGSVWGCSSPAGSRVATVVWSWTFGYVVEEVVIDSKK